MKANELRPGNAVVIDGQIWVVVKAEHVKPGKGPAYAATKIKNLATGSNIEKRFGSTEEVQGTTLDRREMEYLYSDGTGHVFMDGETFDQVTLQNDLVGDSMAYLKPNSSATVLLHEDNPVLVELPSTVELEVTDTPPGIKGATATNQLKEATLETGLKTRVPPFIGVGEVVKVSTADGSYMSRVSS